MPGLSYLVAILRRQSQDSKGTSHPWTTSASSSCSASEKEKIFAALGPRPDGGAGLGRSVADDDQSVDRRLAEILTEVNGLDLSQVETDLFEGLACEGMDLFGRQRCQTAIRAESLPLT